MNKNHSKKKRNYPKARKKACSFKTQEYRLQRNSESNKKSRFGTIKEILTNKRSLYSAKIISKVYGKYIHWTTTGYLRKKFGWVRLVTSRDETLAKSVLNGNVPLSHYKYIKFSEEIKNEVLQKYSR